MSKFVYLAGNVSEGFTAYGPFKDFDECCDECDGVEGWVMEMHSITELRRRLADAALADGLKAEIDVHDERNNDKS
jgi:hypothetical protein